jgi:lipoprotein signal peptidase
MFEKTENSETKSPQPKQSDHHWSFFFLCLIFFTSVIIDQLVKHLVLKEFLNYNFAFSLPVPSPLMFAIYAAVIAAMVYHILKNHRRLTFLAKLAWTLIFAGAASNIIERILLGYVRDFIYISFYRWTGVYNLADGYIIAGVLLLLLAPRSLRNTKITKY